MRRIRSGWAVVGEFGPASRVNALVESLGFHILMVASLQKQVVSSRRPGYGRRIAWYTFVVLGDEGVGENELVIKTSLFQGV